MKSILKFLISLSLLLGLFACSSLPTEEDSSSSVKSSVKFTMQNIANSANSNILFSSTDEQTPSKVALTYKKSGEEEDVSTTIELTAFGNSYITDDVLSLYEGNYEVTKFDILNDEGETIYSTPVSGSQKAIDLNITTALAYGFEVKEGEISTEKMQVVAVSDTTDPADFGHAAFTFDKVNFSKFYIDVLVLDDSLGWVYTTAQVEVKNAEGTTIKTASLDGKMNKILVANSDSYTITISKDGYASQELSSNKDDLAKYENEAMVVKLKKNTNIVTDGLVAYYPFDNDANDISGNEHNGTVYGNTSLVEGKVGKAYSFNGNGDYIYVPFDEDFNFASNGQFSISIWLYWDNVTTRSDLYANILGKADANDCCDWVLEKASDNKIKYVQDNSGDYIYSSEAISAYKWYHIVLTYNNGVVKYYINDKLDSSHSSSVRQSNSGLTFARKGDSGNIRWLHGKLDEARIYNRELSQEEITELYKQGN